MKVISDAGGDLRGLLAEEGGAEDLACCQKIRSFCFQRMKIKPRPIGVVERQAANEAR